MDQEIFKVLIEKVLPQIITALITLLSSYFGARFGLRYDRLKADHEQIKELYIKTVGLLEIIRIDPYRIDDFELKMQIKDLNPHIDKFQKIYNILSERWKQLELYHNNEEREIREERHKYEGLNESEINLYEEYEYDELIKPITDYSAFLDELVKEIRNEVKK